MEKMKKKAFVEVDVAATIVIILLFIFLMASLGFMEKSVFKIEETKNKLNNDLFLLNLLRAETPEGRLQERLISDYLEEDFTDSKTQINYVLEEAFGEKVCWTLFLESVIIKEDNNCVDMSDLKIGDLDARTKIPYMINGEIENLEVIFKS